MRVLSGLALLAACSDPSMPDPPRLADAGDRPDARASRPDRPDACVVQPALADAQEASWSWEPKVSCEGNLTAGQFLDLSLPLEEQTGEGNPSSIVVYKECSELLSTWGGYWIRGWKSANPDLSACMAGGDDLFLDGSEDDLTVIPPHVYQVGEEVGPDARWVDPPWIQTEHIQDPAHSTAPTQLWFTTGILGVRIPADDGFHYAFVEIAWDDSASQCEDDAWHARYIPVRWGYNPVADQPLVIPP